MWVKVKWFLSIACVILLSNPSFVFTQNASVNTKLNARIARMVVHDADWVALSTISSMPEISGFPMVNYVPMSDGVPNVRSSGYIYFGLTNNSLPANAIQIRNNVTVLLTPGGILPCTEEFYYPYCYTVSISGCTIQLRPGTNQYALGLRAYASRHPNVVVGLVENNFLLYKLVVENVFVINSKGKPYRVPLKDYFSYVLDKSYW